MRDTADINAAATADNHLLVVGDWRHYVVARHAAVVTEIVPHLVGANRRPTGERGLLMFWRVGADSIADNAFRTLNVATTA